MGKAEIIESAGEGLYTVSLSYNTTWLDARISWGQDKVSELQADRLVLVDELNDLKSEQTQLQDDLYALIAEHTIENDLTTDIRQATVLVIRKREEIAQQQAKIARLDMELLSAEKKLALFQSLSASLATNSQTVWCADYTTWLVGSQSTIEIDGNTSQIMLAPGSRQDDPGVNDGALTPVLPMTVAQACYNFALYPGWQRWTPTFRVGTITALSVAQDLADVTLDDTGSRYQALEINNKTNLSDVPISYMDCHAEAFAVGDKVVVEFGDQSWDNPKVIGFERNPKPCDVGHFVLVVASPSGEEAFAWSMETDSLLVSKRDYRGVLEQLHKDGVMGNAQELQPSVTETYDQAHNHYVDGQDVGVVIEGLMNQPNWNHTLRYIPWVWGKWEEQEVENPAPFYFPYNALSTRFHTFWGIYRLYDEDYPAQGFWHRIVFSHSALIDPDTEFLRASYMQRYLYHAELAHTRSNKVAVHWMFDAEFDWDGWDPVYPPDPDTYGWMFHEWDARQIRWWTEDKYAEEHPSDFATQQICKEYNLERQFHSHGMASDDATRACFEYAAVCLNFRHKDENCDGKTEGDEYVDALFEDHEGRCVFENSEAEWPRGYIKELRLYAKKRQHTMSELEAQAFTLVNHERTSRDIEPLVWNHILDRVARRHSDDMAEYEFMAHKGSDDSWPIDRASDAGYLLYSHKGKWVEAENGWLGSVVGENLAKGGSECFDENTDPAHYPSNFDINMYLEAVNQPEYAAKGAAEHAVALWMGSTEGHREAILADGEGAEFADDYTEAALCVTENNGLFYWTLNFGVRYNFFPGYAAIPTAGIVSYMDSNFAWDPEKGDGARVPRLYLM